jgi:8-oxo-dGTP pyrophosphatase MutT (NUDIX family)
MMSPYYQALRRHVGHALLIYPSVCAALVNEQRELLLVCQHGSADWEFPGGIEPYETIHEALVRELREELWAEVSVDRLLAVYSSPVWDRRFANGDAIQPLMFLFAARLQNPQALVPPFVATEEIADARYFPASALPLPLMRPCCQYKARDAFDPPHDIVDPMR